jgi:F-type H+-transporting ATPase subunit b
VTRPIRFLALSAWRALALSSVSFLLMAIPALAEEAAPAPENSQAGWVFRWINFAIVLGAIVYFFVKVAAPALRLRSEEIAQKIAEGARAREAADTRRREVQAKLAGVDKEIALLREEAKRSALAEAARLKALARQEAEVIERAAQAEIRAAQRAAALELKSLAARLAIERAEATLANQITPEAQTSLFRAFVAELDRSPN